jgi:hypothetical protein
VSDFFSHTENAPGLVSTPILILLVVILTDILAVNVLA